MHTHADVTALAAAIRDHRPTDLYADDAARMMWYALVGAAGVALFGADERARREFLALCEGLSLHQMPPTHMMTPAERREWQLRNQLWKRIARARAATATMKLANERRHEIFIVVPDWRQWPVAPWYTAKLQRWELMTRKQRRRLLRRVFRPPHTSPRKLRTILSRVK